MINLTAADLRAVARTTGTRVPPNAKKSEIASLIASRMNAIASKSKQKRNVKGGQGQEYPAVVVKWGNEKAMVTYDDVTSAISFAPENLLALYNKINDTNQSHINDAAVFKFGKSLIKNTPAKSDRNGKKILATLFGKQGTRNC